MQCLGDIGFRSFPSLSDNFCAYVFAPLLLLYDLRASIFARLLVKLLQGSLISHTNCNSSPVLDFGPLTVWIISFGMNNWVGFKK